MRQETENIKRQRQTNDQHIRDFWKMQIYWCVFWLANVYDAKKTDHFCNTDVLYDLLQAICTEAGLLALRERRMKVTNEDFRQAKENVLYRKNEGTPEGLYL